MSDAPPHADTRKHLLDGGYTVALLTVAIVAGYGILATSPAKAKSVTRPDTRPPVVVGVITTPPVESPQASIPDTSRTPPPVRRSP